MTAYKITAEQQTKFKRTGIPYYVDPDHPNYVCLLCGNEIPDGCSVGVLTNKAGDLIGVVASSDSNPYTAGTWLHRCGTGTDHIPDDLKAHDHKSDEAKQIRESYTGQVES